MARSTAGARPGRLLALVAALTVLLYVLIFFIAPDKVGDDKVGFADKFTPRLGLDLEGGTQVTLKPKLADGKTGNISSDAINQAVSIIRQRVDGFGVAEAEVTKQGTGNNQQILISIPGSNKDILNQVKQTAELRFRQVLVETSAAPNTATPPATSSASPNPTATSTPAPSATPTGGASVAPAPTATSNGRAVSGALKAATATPTAGSSAPASSGTPAPTSSPVATSAEEQLLNSLTPAQIQQFSDLDCTNPGKLKINDVADKVLFTCDTDGTTKYILGPASLVGTDVKSASSGLQTNSQGVSTGEWVVNLNFTKKGGDKFSNETARVTRLTTPQNQIAITLDGKVVSAPSINERIPNGRAEISGSFTQKTSTDLANVLKYGALPLAFTASNAQEISPELGSDSLHGGLVAGAIGLALVVIYMLLYYRRLGLVAVASLVVAGVLSIGLVTLLGWHIGYRLSLAGIAGMIVSIGVTADSFVIYFERLRDEVREGKSVRVAVESGWARARRTIISSDIVSLLAAAVLYFLSTAGVKGFAFTLGLTTFVDLLVIFLFTKPLVTVFARSAALSSGKHSGLDPHRLGARSAPSPSLTLARSRERRIAAERAAATPRPAGASGEEV